MSEITLNADNTISQGNEIIGRYDDETNTVHLKSKPVPKVYGAISGMIKGLGKEKPKYDIAPENNKDEHGDGATQIPSHEPAPEMSGQLGDMTPDYVKWFFCNHSREEFDARYSGGRLSVALEIVGAE